MFRFFFGDRLLYWLNTSAVFPAFPAFRYTDRFGDGSRAGASGNNRSTHTQSCLCIFSLPSSGGWWRRRRLYFRRSRHFIVGLIGVIRFRATGWFLFITPSFFFLLFFLIILWLRIMNYDRTSGETSCRSATGTTTGYSGGRGRSP